MIEPVSSVSVLPLLSRLIAVPVSDVMVPRLVIWALPPLTWMPRRYASNQALVGDDMRAREDVDGIGRWSGRRLDRRPDVIVEGDGPDRIEEDAARRVRGRVEDPVIDRPVVVDRAGAVPAELDRRARSRADVTIVGDGVDAGARDVPAAIDQHAALFAHDVTGRLVHQAAVDIETDARVRGRILHAQDRVYVGDRAEIGEGDRGDAVDGDRILARGGHGRAHVEHVVVVGVKRLPPVAGLDHGLGLRRVAGRAEGKRCAERNQRRRGPMSARQESLGGADPSYDATPRCRGLSSAFGEPWPSG